MNHQDPEARGRSANACARLLGALEELAGEEDAALREHDWATVALLQQRSAPLAAQLAGEGPTVVDAGLRTRLAAYLSRRRETGEWLAGQIALARGQLREIEAAERRVARLAPAYRQGGSTARRLCATG